MDKRLTNSQRSCAQTCLRKHQLAYVHGIRRIGQAKPLRMGSVVHEALDRAAKTDKDEAIHDAVAWYRKNAPSDADDLYAWRVEAETVAVLLSGYFWRWQEQMFEVVASEITVEAPIINPETGHPMRTFSSAGKIDKIWKLPDGRLAVGEHKTTGDDIAPDSDYWQRLRIDNQISGYLDWAQFMGFPVQTVIYDVIRKPSIRPKKVPVLDENGHKVVHDREGQRVYLANGKPRQSASEKDGWTLYTKPETPEQFGERLRLDIGERPDFYYARREIPRVAADMEEARFDVWQTAKLIADCDRYDRWPRNTRACLTMGRCAYFTLCTNGFIVGDPLPDGFEVVDDVHVELAE